MRAFDIYDEYKFDLHTLYPRFLKLYFKMNYQIECKVLFFFLSYSKVLM